MLSTTLVVLLAATGVYGQYSCYVANQGKRIQEGSSPTQFDCRDSNGGNTCKGGQCVALVVCSCTRNGKYPSTTSYWRPGTYLRKTDGTCNRAVAYGTAIATFDSNGRYTEHAAIFTGCIDNYTIGVWDQWCSRSVGYSSYSSSHRFYSKFAVITSSSSSERASVPCRLETAGWNDCYA